MCSDPFRSLHTSEAARQIIPILIVLCIPVSLTFNECEFELQPGKIQKLSGCDFETCYKISVLAQKKRRELEVWAGVLQGGLIKMLYDIGRIDRVAKNIIK